MLRPQVFALQESGDGGPAIGFAASEKQAIDAALESLSTQDDRFWPRADRYWNARGGSHTDGGAFRFRIKRDGVQAELICTDKFGRRIRTADGTHAYQFSGQLFKRNTTSSETNLDDKLAAYGVLDNLSQASYQEIIDALELAMGDLNDDNDRTTALDLIRNLMDANTDSGSLRRSSLLVIFDHALDAWVTAIRAKPTSMYHVHSFGEELPHPQDPFRILVVDAAEFPPEGDSSLARELVRLVKRGYQHLIVVNTRGHRFICNGLGPEMEGIQIEVFGSSGDYLASGIDGAEITVHGSAQDQVAQIMKSGRLVIHGDVGQTFMYGAKGGEAFVSGNAAGRPLINAVGKPRVVINGTCLDYLAESFMAGDPLEGGGFVILNGLRSDGRGGWEAQETPYPGGNLFSLASGGAIFLRDPHRMVTEDQLNGGAFAELTDEYWRLIQPLLEQNERYFGIAVDRLLKINGEILEPKQVYRVILPAATEALQPEAAWVRQDH
jgi:glutamate synthase domain-containing protein 3